jgi:hypothetical protein
VFWLDFHMPAQTQRVCTKQLLRLCHRRDGDCRETVVTSSAA